MRTLKIVAAMAVMAVPGVSLAATAIKADAQPVSRPAPVRSESLKVPTLSQLNEEIDRDATAKPLPNFRLPDSTRKIMNKLPEKLSKKKPPAKGHESLKSGDFTGAPESEADAAGGATIDGRPVNSATARSSFEVKVNEPKKELPEMQALTLAAKAYAVGQYESAVALYKTALKADEKNRDALFGIATSYHRSGQKAQAKEYYAKLLTLYPYDTEGQNNFLALVGEESPAEALKELDALSRSNPDHAPVYAQKALIYSKLGDDQQAIKNLYQALKLKPDDNIYKYNLAVLFDKAGYYENAARLYSDLIADSYKGEPIPASTAHLTDRMTFIKSKIKSPAQ